MTRRLAKMVTLAALSLLVASEGCAVGQGWGVVDGCLHLPGCSLDGDGGEEPFASCTTESQDFHFRPDFFAAEVQEDGSITIRVQRGAYRLGESDGLMITIPDRVWAGSVAIGDMDDVPAEARYPVVAWEDLEATPLEHRFKVTAYLNGSCPDVTVAFSQPVGEIWFFSMMQSTDLGDPRDQPRIHIGFELEFVDPWPEIEAQPDSARLHVIGEISFDYQRGSPAQEFP